MKKIYNFFIKNLLCILLFLILGIICKYDASSKDIIYSKLYQDYLDFSSVRNFYDKYLGGVFPIENVFNLSISPVFNEEFMYKDYSSYEDGVLFNVDYNYLVPAIKEGIVVYIGEKEKYGNVVIIEGSDGIDIWYGNLCNAIVKLYDNILVGGYIGEVCDNNLYVVYTKKNEFLNYEDYLN